MTSVRTKAVRPGGLDPPGRQNVSRL